MKDKVKEVYEYIRDSSRDGIPPSIREICRDLGIRSTSTAHRYINQLVEEGLLEKSSGRNRSVKLTGMGAVHVPLMGTITAGEPITAIEDITDYIAFQPDKNYSGQLFALNVRGDSMINAGILSGDIVVIEQTSYVDDGTIAACLVDGEGATIKTFYKEDGHYRLQPENDFMDPIIVDNCEILGKVVAVIRYME